MLDIPSFLARAEALARKSDRSEATVSKWLFGDANTIKRLRAGGSCTVATLLRANDELCRREIGSDVERRGAA